MKREIRAVGVKITVLASISFWFWNHSSAENFIAVAKEFSWNEVNWWGESQWQRWKPSDNNQLWFGVVIEYLERKAEKLHPSKLTNPSAEGNCSECSQDFILVDFFGLVTAGNASTHDHTSEHLYKAEPGCRAPAVDSKCGFSWGTAAGSRAASSQKCVPGLCAHIWTFCANEW